jgi:predicted neuraminidase
MRLLNMRSLILSLMVSAVALCAAEKTPAQPGLVSSEFIYEKAPFPECHASTIEQTKGGLVAAWFGGTEEKHPDVGIWVSRLVDGKWSAPVEVANGAEEKPKRLPCWNPVLFQPKDGPLLLFYKLGPDPAKWWGMLKTSTDGGKTWSAAARLPDGIIGPVKNKPIQLANGDLLCGSSTEDNGWRVHFERTSDLGKTWQIIGPIHDGKKIGAIQPSILRHADGTLQSIGRTRQNRVFTTDSKDNGATWSEMALLDLPNPNSGTDAVTLADGRHLLVYNHSAGKSSQWDYGRRVLNVAISKDGRAWEAALVLEDHRDGEYSYPAVIQADDGKVHITCTWKRQRIRHVVVDLAKLELRPITRGEWPK